MKCPICGTEMEVVEQDYDPPTETGYVLHKCPKDGCNGKHKDLFP